MSAPILVGGQELAIAPHATADERTRPVCGLDPFAPAEHAARMRDAADGKRVPRHQHFLVAARPHTLLARSQELGASRFNQWWVLRGMPYAEVPVAVFEVGRCVKTIAGREGRIFVRCEQRSNFLAVPDVELAFLVLAV